MKNQTQEAIIKTNGLILPNGEIHVGEGYFLLESGQSWMFGFIHFGEMLRLIRNIKKDIRELGVIAPALNIRSQHGFLISIGIQRRIKDGEIF